MTPERYAVNAMYEAIGALRAAHREGDGLDAVIRRLEISIQKIGGKDECRHDGMVSVRNPDGTHTGHCRKCGQAFSANE